MNLEIIKSRRDLVRTRSAIESRKLTVGFLGGSITDPRPGYNWPEPVIAWLADRYPDVRLTVENAAIGATGSDHGVFRADRDIIARGCDLVFVEYAVNDTGTDTITRRRSREGLLRKLLSAGLDVVIVYTFAPDMYADMAAGREPATIAEFETLAEHYSIPSVWMGLHALNEVNRGTMRWHEWLPDNLHPEYRGSQVYSDSVTAYLEHALNADDGLGETSLLPTIPPALDPQNWETARTVSLGGLKSSGPWTLRRWPHYVWIDQSLESSAPGSRVEFAFHGRMVWMALDFGKRSADFRYRVDSGEWTVCPLERFEWVGDSGWLRGITVVDGLALGDHTIEIETVFTNSPRCTSTDFKIGLLGYVGE